MSERVLSEVSATVPPDREGEFLAGFEELVSNNKLLGSRVHDGMTVREGHCAAGAHSLPLRRESSYFRYRSLRHAGVKDASGGPSKFADGFATSIRPVPIDGVRSQEARCATSTLSPRSRVGR